MRKTVLTLIAASTAIAGIPALAQSPRSIAAPPPPPPPATSMQPPKAAP
ncbi:MAG: GDSL family lipase, partial [Oxalobacteraceae bacterium]